jgi:hypothetical protein
VLAQLLAADPGYRGPRLPRGRVRPCRDKGIGPVPGPVTLARGWDHRAACGHRVSGNRKKVR